MPRRYDMMMPDGRNPYGSAGGYVVSSRGRNRARGRERRDRDMYPDMRTDGRIIRNYPHIRRYSDYAEYDGDMRYDAPEYRDGAIDRKHYPKEYGETYYPIEAMGRFNGYWGMPREENYDRYRYGDYGDYGETLSDEEIKEWEHKLLSHLNERERQMLSKEAVMQRIHSMGKEMRGFGDKEMYVATLMVYTDYKTTIGENVDMAVKLAYDWLADDDVAVKGAEKLAVYYDCIVEGE